MQCLTALCMATAPAGAADIYAGGNWSAMASDRNAHAVGDSLMVVVYESATATNTASSGSTKNSSFGGQLGAGTFNQSANLNLQGQSDNSGTVGRSGGMVAQISVTVDQIMPDGDLHVSGAQQMIINGDKTNIRIQGLVRPADVMAGNMVLSTRLANATIVYDGSGFVSSSAKPGLVTRIFNWLGIP